MELTEETRLAIEANSKSFLQHCVKEYRIFVDTSSLLEERCDKFIENIVPLLRSNNSKLYVAVQVIAELRKHISNKDNQELSSRAMEQLELLQQLGKEGMLVALGEEKELYNEDTFADPVFYSKFVMLCRDHKLLFITQDIKLAKAIMGLNNLDFMIMNKVLVKKVNRYGFLSNIELEGQETGNSGTVNADIHREKINSEKNKKPASEAIPKVVPEEQKFTLCKKVTSVPNTVMSVTHLPVAGETVKTSTGRQICLGELIGEGGEGCIYGVDESCVAKIYHKECIKNHTYEKIKRMIDKKLRCEGICFPTEMIYNSNNQFVGYIMPKARGKELEVSVFRDKQILKMFPDGKKIHLVDLSLNILRKIKYLHDRNILMGDINGRNILLCSDQEVYFVDTDSYQIDDLPSCVGMEEYTPPEFQGIKYEEKLRTLGNENFAIATLLFRLMMLGKLPYAQLSAEDDEKNIITLIKEMDFPYPLDENSTGKAPDGPWRDMWSQLAYCIKEKFYKTFRKCEVFATEETRPDTEEWIKVFQKYKYLLDSGQLAKKDPMSEDIKPTRGKLHENVANKNCAICNMLIPENQLREGICKECQRRGEIYRCENCKKELIYTNLDRLKGKKKRYLCEMCYKKKYSNTTATEYPAPMKITIVNGQMVQSERPASRLTVNPKSTRPPAAQTTTAYRSTTPASRSTTTQSHNRTATNYNNQRQTQPQQFQPQKQNNKPKGRFNKKIATAVVAIAGYMAFKTFGFAVIPLAILAVIVHHARNDD